MKNYILFILFFLPVLAFSQKRDSLVINFPQKYKLVLKNDQQDSRQILREWIPNGQNWENYDIIATMSVVKNANSVSIDQFKNLIVKGLKEKTKGFKYTELDKNDNAKDGYLIFKCESDSYKNSNDKESQIYFLIKGKSDLFANIIALKTDKFSDEFVEEWRKIFKESKFVE